MHEMEDSIKLAAFPNNCDHFDEYGMGAGNARVNILAGEVRP